jgi:hypothetical protein
VPLVEESPVDTVDEHGAVLTGAAHEHWTFTSGWRTKAYQAREIGGIRPRHELACKVDPHL